jgi:transaldolase
VKPMMRTQILVDGGDPAETLRMKNLIGGVDGQTTNPTLISRNPEIRELISSGHKLSREQELDEYKKIVRRIAPLVGNARL